jgi:hypothetical protein
MNFLVRSCTNLLLLGKEPSKDALSNEQHADQKLDLVRVQESPSPVPARRACHFSCLRTTPEDETRFRNFALEILTVASQGNGF